MKYLNPILYLLFYITLCGCGHESLQEMDLSGQWQFRTDKSDQGILEEWYADELPGTIRLPGSMAENGKGDDISLTTQWTGNMWNDSLWYTSPEMAKYRQKNDIKVPFWLSPDKVYYGPAWYQKQVKIPGAWKNKHIVLQLERAHWETTVWVDDNKVGSDNRLGTPHHYTLSDYLTPGDHTITLRVDNRVKEVNVGLDAHSITDNTQTNWNGIVGEIKLSAVSQVFMEDVQVYPDVSNHRVTVKTKIRNFTGASQPCQLEVVAKGLGDHDQGLSKIVRELEVDAEGRFEMEYSMGDSPLLWDEFNPHLYSMELALKSSSGIDKKEVTFGMREFKVDGKHFSINGRPVFLRGTLECAIFPLTGYPPMEVNEWKRILKTIRDHGLNHMRFHSWCPPKAAFQAADELGIYLQVEASAWAKIGDGQPIDAWVYQEAEHIVKTYGNHPSFVMMAYGNEPGGKNHAAYLGKFVDHMKRSDDRRVYTGAAGWPFLENADYYNSPAPRIQQWGAELKSIINSKPPQTAFDYSSLIEKTPMPHVSHEIGQWCVYPNFREMAKYTGVLKPWNFEIFKETLEANHLGHLADSFLLASGKLQALCYKADIEAALRTKDFAGFQLLDLHDFPGQGTALVGVLDAFWEEKGYISPEEYREFCDETVPLARLDKRIFLNTDTLKAALEVAHYGERPLKDITASWRLTDTQGKPVEEGDLPQRDIPVGNGLALGNIAVDLSPIEQAQKLTLTLTVAGDTNRWDVWVYPEEKRPIVNEDQLQVVEQLNVNAISFLERGGKVLLNINKGDIAQESGGAIGVGFSSIFWNTSWTKGQKPHTLGILCNPDHPALADFPTAYHSDWQWWDAMSNANAIVLDAFTPELVPIVRIVDDWFENRRTALIFEVRVGKGKLLVSGIDLHTNIAQRYEAQQLLYSLKKYMASDRFNPKVVVDKNKLDDLFDYNRE